MTSCVCKGILYILFCTDRYPVITDSCLLDRYSLQRSVRFKKYYKSLFLGLLDLALVNALIVFKARHDSQQNTRHVSFLRTLHVQLCQVEAQDLASMPTRHQGIERFRSTLDMLPSKSTSGAVGTLTAR
jgi:hypothetical protein